MRWTTVYASGAAIADVAAPNAPMSKSTRIVRRRLIARAIPDGAAARGGHETRVLRQHAARVAGRRRLPRGAPFGEHVVGYVELHEELVRVDRDRIAFLDERDGAADKGLGR